MAVNLDDLDDDQRKAAQAPRGPVAILAGAGTGKTRTITYRIGHLIDQGQTNARSVLAVTFTNRAASEMRHRLNLMGIGGVQALTFHSAARRQLSYFWPQVYGDLPWRIEEKRFPIIARAARPMGVDTSVENLRDFLAEVEWAKSSLITPDMYADKVGDRKIPETPEKVAEIYRRYEAIKSSPDGMLFDFNDLLLHTAGALENSTAIAEEFRERYRTFVVDEYQDVTPLQQRLLDAWVGPRDDLTVVGDANQTIYSFTGATPNYLLNFSRKYPHATVVKLQRDYRSTPEVTELANTVIGQATGRVAGTRLKLEGMRPSGPKPEFHQYDDEPAEARATASKIKQLIDKGVEPKEIAVLYRVNAQSTSFEEALRDAGIVYQVRGGEEFFARGEIKQAVNALIQTFNTKQMPPEAVGPKLGRVVRAILAPLGLTPQEPEGAQARERWQSLSALAELAEELGIATPDLDLGGLINKLYERSKEKHPPGMQGVTLASLHAAKGLEWDAVFLVGLTEGMLPISHALKAGDYQIEEERRLFYVGVTRAREYLFHSWSKARQEGGKASKKRSRFLDGIVADSESTKVPSRARRPIRCKVCGQPLETPSSKILGRCDDCPSSADTQVFDTLRTWRANAARERGVPAYVVFTDATLMAIAERMPQDNYELMGISGIGQIKVEQFGQDLLDTLAQFR